MVNIDKFITRDTKAGYGKNVYFAPLVDVVDRNDNATIKKINKYVSHPPNY